MIGILGAGGKIGRLACLYATKLLAGQKIIVGCRNVENTAEILRKAGVDTADISFLKLDLMNDKALKAFMKKCDAVLNAAGPSEILSPHIYQAASDTETAVVDIGMAGTDKIKANAPICYGAGAVPGLSGLFPLYMADKSNGEKIYFIYEISDAFGKAGSEDFLRGIRNSSVRYQAEILKIYRDKTSFLNRKRAVKKIEIDDFPFKARIFPYFDDEVCYARDSLKKRRKDGDIECYTAMSGDNFLEFMEKHMNDIAGAKITISEAACALEAATKADADRHGRYLCMKVFSDKGREIFLKTKGQTYTSACVAAITLGEMLKGLPKGTYPLYKSPIAERMSLKTIIDIFKKMEILTKFKEV